MASTCRITNTLVKSVSTKSLRGSQKKRGGTNPHSQCYDVVAFKLHGNQLINPSANLSSHLSLNKSFTKENLQVSLGPLTTGASMKTHKLEVSNCLCSIWKEKSMNVIGTFLNRSATFISQMCPQRFLFTVSIKVGLILKWPAAIVRLRYDKNRLIAWVNIWRFSTQTNLQWNSSLSRAAGATGDI